MRLIATDRRLTYGVVTLMLSLGIGLAATNLTAFYTLLLRPLPYPDSQELLSLESVNPQLEIERNRISMGDFYDFRERAEVFEELAAVGQATLVLTSEGEPEEIPTAAVSSNLLKLLQVQPVLGRGFLKEEEIEGQDQVVILSHRFWQNRFAGDPEIVGRELTLSGYRYEVIGVMPEEFKLLGGRIDFWAPMVLEPSKLVRKRRGIMALGRLRPGVDREDAEREIKRLAAQLAEAYPETNRGWDARPISLQQQMTGHLRPVLWPLAGASVLVLLLVWINVANLLISSVDSRQQEVALRQALGANRGEMLWLFAKEAVLLGLFGGAGGLFLSQVGGSAVRAWAPDDRLRLDETGIETSTLVLVLLLVLLSIVLMSGVMVLRAFPKTPGNSLVGIRPGETLRPQSQRLASTLVIFQIAAALILLTSSTLLLRSFASLSSTEVGFKTERLVVLSLFLPLTKYTDDASRSRFLQELIPRIAQIPGVHSVASTSAAPFNRPGRQIERTFAIEGQILSPTDSERHADLRLISQGYFETIGIPLLAGRDFALRDRSGSVPVAIVSRELARRYWSGQDPIGERLHLTYTKPETFEIVGVVGDVRDREMSRSPRPIIYLSSWQNPSFFASLVIRTRGDPAPILGELKAGVWSLDSEQAVTLGLMDQNISRSLGDQRFTLWVMSLFSAVAVLLALVGLYGLVAAWVSRRTAEIGVRMGLGATPRDIFGLVFKRSVVLTSLGIGLGIFGSYWVANSLRTLLYGISAFDPIAFASSIGLLVFTSLAATWVPAQRAIKIDPVQSIYHE